MLPLIQYEGIEVAPGTLSNIGIERSYYIKMPSPYGNCRDNVDTPSAADSYVYAKTAAITRYSRNLCYQVCFQYKYVIPTCNCSDPSIDSNVDNVPICTILSDGLRCMGDLAKAFDTSLCASDCPEACERVKYSYKVSQSSYPSL